MPGIRFAWRESSSPTNVGSGLFANSMSGAGTPPAAYARGGDLCVFTTASALTASSIVVMRMLLAADKTAHYLQGTPVAGIAGVFEYDAGTDSNGIVNSNVSPAGVATGANITYNFPSMAQGVPQDPATNRSRVQYYSATGNVFCGNLKTGSTASWALKDKLGGFVLSTTAGVTTYTLDDGAAAADSCIVFVSPDESDPNYNVSAGAGRMFFKILGAFDQNITGVPYSSQ